MRLVVAVSGLPGSGKTTYAKYIAEEYGLRYVSNGSLFRELAAEMGMDLEEFHRYAEMNPEIDKMVDQRALEEARKGNVVIDGHFAVWLLREVADLKLVFVAPLRVRAERVARREGRDIDDVIRELELRERSNRERGLKYYGIDIRDLSHADLVLNTALFGIDEVKRIIKTFVDEYLRVREGL